MAPDRRPDYSHEPTLADAAMGTLRRAVDGYVRRHPETPRDVAARAVVHSRAFATVTAIARTRDTRPLSWLADGLRSGDRTAQLLAAELGLRLSP